MNKFRFKYSPIVWVLLAVILAVCSVSIYLNVISVVEYSWANGFKIVGYISLLAISVFIIVFVISIAIYGNYTIKNGYLYTYFGFIHTKTDLNEIVQITHFKKSDKLVIYFKEQKFSVIVIAKSEYDSFVLALRGENKTIIYSTQIDGEDTPNQ